MPDDNLLRMGSTSNPVSLDPFRTIVEVGWPGGYYVIAGLQSGTMGLANANCSPSVGSHSDEATTWHSGVVSHAGQPFGPAEFPGSLSHPLGGSISGTFYNWPTGILTKALSKWQASGTLSHVVEAQHVTTAVIHIFAKEPRNIRCLLVGGVLSLESAELGSDIAVHSEAYDFGAISFIETATANEWAANRITNVDSSGGTFHLEFRRL